MKRFLILMVAAVVGATAAFASAAPPPPPPPPVRIMPSRPVIVPARTVTTLPRGVVIVPTTLSIRPSLTPVRPLRPAFSVYYRYSPFDPWILYESTASLWRAESDCDMLIFDFGFDAFVR